MSIDQSTQARNKQADQAHADHPASEQAIPDQATNANADQAQAAGSTPTESAGTSQTVHAAPGAAPPADASPNRSADDGDFTAYLWLAVGRSGHFQWAFAPHEAASTVARYGRIALGDDYLGVWPLPGEANFLPHAKAQTLVAELRALMLAGLTLPTQTNPPDGGEGFGVGCAAAAGDAAIPPQAASPGAYRNTYIDKCPPAAIAYAVGDLAAGAPVASDTAAGAPAASNTVASNTARALPAVLTLAELQTALTLARLGDADIDALADAYQRQQALPLAAMGCLLKPAAALAKAVPAVDAVAPAAARNADAHANQHQQPIPAAGAGLIASAMPQHACSCPPYDRQIAALLQPPPCALCHAVPAEPVPAYAPAHAEDEVDFDLDLDLDLDLDWGEGEGEGEGEEAGIAASPALAPENPASTPDQQPATHALDAATTPLQSNSSADLHNGAAQ